MSPPPDTRLNRFLAAAGVASRRGADALIAAGRVAVDGEVVADAGRRVRTGQVVTLDGVPVTAEAPAYLALHKPVGVVTTASDPQGRPTVLDLVPGDVRLFPVGRLDLDTSGLLLLTNDGVLAHRLMHPSGEVAKTYRATLAGDVGPAPLDRLRRGVELEDGPTLPADVTVVARHGSHTIVDVVLREGRNRQVRRMGAAVGHPVRELCRIRYGPLALHGLRAGATRRLTPDEVGALRRAAGAPRRASLPETP